MRTDDLLLRSFGADVTQLEVKRDGIVEGLIVPWMRPTDVVEYNHALDAVVEYREQFARGSFARAEKAPDRVTLTFTHSEDLPNLMGYGREYLDSEEGAVFRWKLYESTRELATEILSTSHTGLSVTFRTIRPKYGSERDGALVTRQAVHLSSVAATNNPAYADARVLALRERQEQLREQQEREREQARAQVETLLFLQARGRELSPTQLAYLEQHRAAVSA